MTTDTYLHETAEQQALDWAIRTGELSFEDWDGFSAWLEQDASHAARYDAAVARLASAAEVVATLPPTPPATAVDEAAFVSNARRRWSGGAIAAAFAGVIGIGMVGLSAWSDRPQPYAVATAPGQTRSVILADGGEVIVAGGSRVVLDHDDPRVATVERGAAAFHIHHDARSPFTVHAAGMRIVDLGTVFDVSNDAGVMRVAVAEGRVMVDPDGAALTLDPGQAVRVEGGRLHRQPVEPDEVGGWRDGTLSFDDATLAEVATVLSRSLPQQVTAASTVAATRFSGTFDAARVEHDPALLGRLLGVVVVRTGTGWRLERPR